MDLRCLGDGSWFLMGPCTELLFYTSGDALKQQNHTVLQLCKVEVAFLQMTISSERGLIWRRARAQGQLSDSPVPSWPWAGSPRLGQKPSPVSNEFQWPRWDVLESLTPRVCVQGAGAVLCVCAWACVGWAPGAVWGCDTGRAVFPGPAGTPACQGVCEGGRAEGPGLAEGRCPVLVVCQSISLISPSHPAVTPQYSHECQAVGLSWVLFCFKMNFLHVQQELDQTLPQRQLEDHRRVCTAVEHIQNSSLPFPVNSEA